MKQRCELILEELQNATGPVTASSLAKKLDVSRQIIVNDVAILRASGQHILATSRGYLLREDEGEGTQSWPYVGTIFSNHTADQLADELYTVVDYGGTVIDISIDHAIYGELSGRLDLSSRYDVNIFLKRVKEEASAAPLSTLTAGAHFHRIGCRDKEMFDMIYEELLSKGLVKTNDEVDD